MKSNIVLANFTTSLNEFLVSFENGDRIRVPYKDTISVQYSFILIQRVNKVVKFVEVFKEEKHSDWSCNIYMMPLVVFHFFLPIDEKEAWKNLLKLEGLLGQMVHDLGLYDNFKHKDALLEDVIDFIGDWWLPK
ncbi:MAG TPA: hypothetical protein PLS49_07710 [Candidatus Woesebacteria bacterium]|nr:hypothetical protein [Candidatus Woesebacteria bacterium]